MLRKACVTLAAAAVTLGAPSAASAAVTFDSESGKGFVGKGDVQIPFGWNDATLQKNATGVTFGYDSKSDDTYSVQCAWETGNKKVVRHTQTKSASISSSVAYDVTKVDRKNPNGKVTGFNLTGKGQVVVTDESGHVPVVGDSCPESEGDGVDKTITDVELLSSEASESLTARHGSLSAVVWPPAPAA